MTCERVSLTVCLPHLPVHVQRGLSAVGGHSLRHIFAELIDWMNNLYPYQATECNVPEDGLDSRCRWTFCFVSNQIPLRSVVYS